MCSSPRPTCCGNWTETGECRGYCAVPERCGDCEQCNPRPPEHCEALTTRGLMEGEKLCGVCAWCRSNLDQVRGQKALDLFGEFIKQKLDAMHREMDAKLLEAAKSGARFLEMPDPLRPGCIVRFDLDPAVVAEASILINPSAEAHPSQFSSPVGPVTERTLQEWRADFREDGEDRFARAPLWEPFLCDKINERIAQASEIAIARHLEELGLSQPPHPPSRVWIEADREIVEGMAEWSPPLQMRALMVAAKKASIEIRVPDRVEEVGKVFGFNLIQADLAAQGIAVVQRNGETVATLLLPELERDAQPARVGGPEA